MASQTTKAVDKGRIEAANSDAFNKPKAKRKAVYFPASGRSAWAASAAVSTRTPAGNRVAAQVRTMNAAISVTMTLPMMTSQRANR
jgi:hypothetical protein